MFTFIETTFDEKRRHLAVFHRHKLALKVNCLAALRLPISRDAPTDVPEYHTLAGKNDGHSQYFNISKTTRSYFTEIFYTCYLWPWLGPPLSAMKYVMHFRFCG